MDSSTSGASRLVLLNFGKYRNTMVTILSAQQKLSIKVLMALVLLACYHNSIRVRLYLLRAALVPPSLSPWLKLYDEGDSSSFLHVTGLTREAFDSLEESQHAPATQGEAVVASAGWDAGTFTLLSG
jgi:hypothetical protein